MSKSKRRVLAGIMSLLLLITSVFTGNVMTVRAEGLVINVVEDYDSEGVYVVSEGAEQVAFSSVLIPKDCCFVVETAITVSGAITVNPGGRLEVLGNGSIKCGSFSVGASEEGKDPSLFFDGTSNVPEIGGTALDLYEHTGSELSAIQGFEYSEFIYDYSNEKWVRFINPYDAFGPNETYPTIVEVALLGYDRRENDAFPISFPEEFDTIDGWDRMKARVNGDSLTISWNAGAKPLQICVEGANNGNWLIDDVADGATSYTITLKQGASNYVEVKYKSDYDLFGPDEANPILVEVEYKNVPEDVNPSISFQNVGEGNYIYDGKRLIKARVSGASATITWEGAATPTKICESGAEEHAVTGEETSYTIYLNRMKDEETPEDYYYVEVKYGPDSPSGDDITYDKTDTIPSDTTANNVTISGNGTAVTLDKNVSLRIDGILSVGGTAQLKGTDHTSVLELGKNASIDGIDVYNSAGAKLSNDSHWYTNSGEGVEEFEWDSTNEYWKLRSSQAENHSIDVEFIPDLSALPGDDTSNFAFSIKGFQDDGGAVASVSDRVDFSKSSNGGHTFHLSIPDNAVKLGFSLSNAGKKVESASYKIGEGEEHPLTESEIGLLKTENGINVLVCENDVWATSITFEVKLTEDSGDSDDITYNSDTRITSNLSKDNVTIAEGCTLTVDNCTLTIGQSLTVNSNANAVGISDNSKLEFQPNASSDGIALYNTQGTEITGGQQVSFTNGSGTTVFTWNTSNSHWETEQAETGGNGEIIGNETKDVVIKFWKLENGEYVQADISQFDRMGLNGKIFAAGELVDANYKVTKGSKDSGTNGFFFKGGFLNKITKVELISSFTETDGKKTEVTIDNTVKIEEGDDEIFLNQDNVEEGRIKSPWRAELPVTAGETEEYNFLITELQRSSIVWTGATEDNYHGYGPDAYVEYGKVQLVSIKNGETDLIADKSADVNEDSYDLDKNEGYIFAPVGSTVTVRLVPDYGYQVIGAEINGVQALTAGETVSTFSFVMPECNIHFRGVFTPSTDKITTPASEVSSAIIGDASNAASSGNLSLNVEDNTTYTKTEEAKTTALGGDTTKVATTVATLDMTLDNIVNKNAEDSYWTTSVTEFTSPITVGLKLNDVTLADGEELVVVREHNGVLEKISATYNATTGTLSVPTNKFSTYTIVKKTAKKDLFIANVTLGTTSYTYDGSAKTPTISVDGTAINVDDYTISYSNSNGKTGENANKTAGTVTVTITAKDTNAKYKGSTTKNFTIAKAEPDIGNVTVGYSSPIYTSTLVSDVESTLTRTDESINGTLKFKDLATFSEVGTKNYTWEFTPTDTVNYTTKTGNVSLTVSENALASISKTGTLTTTSYKFGDQIDLSGITFTAHFANGDTRNLELAELKYTKELATGQTSLVVAYARDETKSVTVDGFTVSKATIDISALGWTVGTYNYSGTAQGPTFSTTLPAGITVSSVSDNSKVNVGSYTASATVALIGTGNYTSQNYELVQSGTTASIAADKASATFTAAWSIAKVTPQITFTKTSDVSNSITGAKVALTPASSDATPVIEYFVVVTPAVEAVEGQLCRYEGMTEHTAECAKTLDENATCDCGYEHTCSKEVCGYVAAVPGSPEVKNWVTTVPTAVGTYQVRATLPEENKGENLNAVITPVTGTYTITQYTPPAVNNPNNGSDTGSGSESSSSSSSSTTTTPVPTTPVVTEPVAEVTAPAATEDTTAEKPATTETTTRRPATTTEENEIETTPDETTGVSSADGSEGWKDIKEEISDKLTVTGEEAVVVVEMNGEDIVPADIFENIKGKDITVTFDMGNGIVWAVNGKDVTGDSFEDINFSASTGDGVTAIPAELISGLTEERFSMELTLEYEGEFGFTAVMSVNVDKKNAGKYANLFYFNPKTETMEFICSAPVKEDGTADLTFTHASDYVIVVDEVPLSAADNTSIDKVEQPVPQETPSENDTTEIGTTEKDVFNPLWIIVIGIVVLLIGGIAILIVKKKND